MRSSVPGPRAPTRRARTRSLALALALTAALPLTAVAQRTPVVRRPRLPPARLGGPGPFAGTFGVRSNTTVRIVSPIAQTESRATEETVVVTPTPGAGMALSVTNTLGDRCELTANRTAERALAFVPGAECDVTDNVRNVRLHVTLTSGTATLTGDAIALRLHWNVAATVFFMPVSGTGVQTGTGSRR